MKKRMQIPANWTFKDKGVAEGFDRHVREQLPWYDLMTGAVAHVARHYIPEGGMVYDLGASTGNMGKAMEETLRTRKARLVAVDNSEQMARIYSGPGEIVTADICTFPFEEYDFGVAFLCFMFIPPTPRAVLLRNLREKIRKGGALVVVDKCLPAPGYPGVIMSRLALAGKMAAEVPPFEIISKELSLSGVQRPVSPEELSPAVELFRFGDFAGWIIEG